MNRWDVRSWGFAIAAVLAAALFTRTGKPLDNTHVEAFHGTFRRECLSQRWFNGLEEARRTIRNWREDYDKTMPHSSLGQQTPVAFAAGGDFTQGRIGIQNSQS